MIENNRIKRAWIWLWYNDITRLAVLVGLPIIPVVAISAAMFGVGGYLRVVAAVTYVMLVAWGILDNDYSNLRRIGMDEYRKKLGAIMANMGYYRFRNTLLDLQDCRRALDGMGDYTAELDDEELEAALKLLRLCKLLADDYLEDR